MASVGFVTVSERRSTGRTVGQYMGVTEIEAPEGFTLRVPRMEEAGEVAALINAAIAAAGGPPDNSESEVRCAWTTPGIDFESAFRVVVDDTGRIVGYLSLEEREPFTKIWLDGFTHPEFLGHGIGSCLLRYAETRAGELATWAAWRGAYWKRTATDSSATSTS
jgi:GNAT superfamily N-acetyltransferase